MYIMQDTCDLYHYGQRSEDVNLINVYLALAYQMNVIFNCD